MGPAQGPAISRTILVLQHTEAEYLGLMEDHFEGRNIRFAYCRPFTPGGTIPASDQDFDGLMLLGGGPYGLVSGHLLPSFAPELRLTKMFLAAGKPVLGLELGALILSVAAAGGADEAPLRFEIATAVRQGGGAAIGLPETMPLACYLRDRPVLPKGAELLAADAGGTPLIFRIGPGQIGCVGHPGMKSGMAEDLIMEFAETPDDTAATLSALRAAQGEIAEALGPLMVGLIADMALM